LPSPRKLKINTKSPKGKAVGGCRADGGAN
jgi:hypothetical protein